MQTELKSADARSAAAARQTAVLFAGIAGGEESRFAAKELRLLTDTLGQAVDLSGGRVVSRRAGEVMALFPTPDAAATAAMRMHAYAETLGGKQGKVAVRIGFHCGPVVQRGDDILGDTVNLALALAEHAKAGQIVTSERTAASLSPAVQERVRLLGQLQASGSDEPVVLGELVWRKGPYDAGPAIITAKAASRAQIRISYRGTIIVRRREGDRITMGREGGCDLVVSEPTASRRHCTVVRRNAKFILTDHSANGTYVTLEKEGETVTRTSTITLSGRGTIALGQPRAATREPVTFACE